MRQIDKTAFMKAMNEGFTGQMGVMPPWSQDPNVNKYFEELWSYLQARSRRRAAARKTQAPARGAVSYACVPSPLVAAALLAAAPAGAQAPWDTLKVCADPNNLPFSNRDEEGFENKLAQIWARELGVEVEYTWFPHRRGFERNTLNAEDPERGGYKCDVIVGVPDGYDLAMTTRPYYRSTYALVYVAGRELDIRDAEDLIDLPRAARDALRIGVFTPSPAAEWLARHGMYEQMVPYSALDGDPDVYPGKIIENELLAGELDAAILWGPIAGYFAARARAGEGRRRAAALRAGHPVRVRDGGRRALRRARVARAARRSDGAHGRGDDGALRRIPHSGHRGAGGARLRDERGCGHDQHHLDGHAERDRRSAGRHSAARRRGQPRRRAASTSRCPARRNARRRCRTRSARSSRADKTKDGIAVIDARRRAVLRVLPGGSDPEEFDVDAASGRLFVSNEDAGELSIVDLETRRGAADGRRRRRARRRAVAPGSEPPSTSRARATTR